MQRKDEKVLEIVVWSVLFLLGAYAFWFVSKIKTRARERAKFEALFKGNPEAAAYLDPDFRILDINPRFEQLFGYFLTEVKGKHIDEVVVQKSMKEEAKTLNEKALGGYVYQNTVRRRKDGSLVPVAVSAAPIMVGGRVPGYVTMYKDISAGYVTVYKDISELKNAEKKLQEMNEKLWVVGGLTRHDVRNKMASITGYVYLTKKKLAQNDEAQGYLAEIDSAVQQVTRIFEFAAAYEKLGVEKLVSVDVGEMVEEAVSLFSDLHGVKVTNECHGLTVLADSLLRQLFYNLIDNSLKHGERTSQIRIYYEKAEGEQFRLVYEDNGVGISPNVKPNLFNEGITSGNGSGYGLYLIKKMIEAYGWTIQETGEPGGGTQFTITIPNMIEDREEFCQLQPALES